LNSAEPRALSGTENARFPFWSPDSKFIAFAADGKLKKTSVDTGSIEIICDVPGQLLAGVTGAWNRRGVIVFGGPNTGLWSVSASAGGPARAVSTPATSRGELSQTHPVFLPDDDHFLYLGGPSMSRGIFVRSLTSATVELVLATNARPL